MKTAMILAAGRGERLRPLTEKIPKAMCLIHNKPLIEYHVAKLALAGFERIVVNHAYLGGQIRRHLGNGKAWGIDLHYSAEPPGGLETGGGIYNALPLLGKNPFVVINADIFTTYDFSLLRLPVQSLVHAVLISDPQYKAGDFGLNQNYLSNQDKRYVYAGIAYYSPEVFQNATLGRYSITPLLRELADKNLATGEVYSGRWIDIGSPTRLQLAQQMGKNFPGKLP